MNLTWKSQIEVYKKVKDSESNLLIMIFHLQELRPPHVEHELRIQREVVRQPEGVGVVLVVLAKLLALQKKTKTHEFHLE